MRLTAGDIQASEPRLYGQLQVFGECGNLDPLIGSLRASGLEGVLYWDLNDPRGVGLLLLTENPDVLVGEARSLLVSEPFASLRQKPALTMIGRTYSTGHERDLLDWLLHKPRRNALNPDWPWAIWYPLRRKPEFELLSKEEQNNILLEHATIGMAYGRANFAHDIRLACHGLDQNDNEFVIGLVGPELYPLSRIVQDMRKTQQTARYMQSLGPFFVGKACWQSPLKV
jgi:chlorite dismutase